MDAMVVVFGSVMVVYRSVMVVFGFRFAEYRQRIFMRYIILLYYLYYFNVFEC